MGKEKVNRKKEEGTKARVQGFNVVEEECIWMKAGVVGFRLCDNAYDCYNCPFDRGMKKAMKATSPEASESSGQPEWVDHMRSNYDGAFRACRHALTGRVQAPKICAMNYECFHCSYDQMLDEMDLALQPGSPAYRLASGYRLADGYYYHMGHSWARFEHGGRVRIGFDDFLVKVFGVPQRLELPFLGATLAQNEVGWSFGRDGHEAAVLSPVSGDVLAVNHKALDHPEITHADPYQEGWLLMLEPRMPKRDLKGLYFGGEGVHWMEEETRQLMAVMGPDYEQLAATGGEPLDDFYGRFPEVGWERLSRTFLRTEKK